MSCCPDPVNTAPGGGGDGSDAVFSPPEQWVVQNVPANQTNVVMSAQVSTNFDDIPMIRTGSIVGLSARLTAAVAAGTLTVQVTINGVGGTLNIVCTAGSNPTGGQTTQAAGIDVYAAGDRLGLRFSTTVGFLPITTDLEAWIEVLEATV